MSKYQRRARSGLVLYHDDLQYLRELPADDTATIIRTLADSSIALAAGEAPPPTPILSGFAAIVCKNMLEKLERDHEKYLDTCEKRRTRNTQADLSELKLTQADFGALTKLNKTKLNQTESKSSPLPLCEGRNDDDGDFIRIQQEHDQVLTAAQRAGFPATDAMRDKIIDLYSEHGMNKLISGINCCIEHGAINLAYLRAVLQGKPKQEEEPFDQWNGYKFL